MALFMVIEQFKGGRPEAVYARFREKGRQMPENIRYVMSWTTADLATCYQVMEAEKPEDLGPWMAAWSDLVEFTVIPVLTSEEAAQRAR